MADLFDDAESLWAGAPREYDLTGYTGAGEPWTPGEGTTGWYRIACTSDLFGVQMAPDSGSSWPYMQVYTVNPGDDETLDNLNNIAFVWPDLEGAPIRAVIEDYNGHELWIRLDTIGGKTGAVTAGPVEYAWTEWRTPAPTYASNMQYWIVFGRDSTDLAGSHVIPLADPGVITSTGEYPVGNPTFWYANSYPSNFDFSTQRVYVLTADSPSYLGPDRVLAGTQAANQDGNTDEYLIMERVAFLIDVTEWDFSADDDPDSMGYQSIEYRGENVLIDGTLTLPGVYTQGVWDTFTPGPNTYAQPGTESYSFNFHLTEVPESHYIDDPYRRPIRYDVDDRAVLAAQSVVHTWVGATPSSPLTSPYYWREVYGTFAHDFTASGPTKAFAVTPDTYMHGVTSTPALNNFYKGQVFTDNMPSALYNFQQREYRLFMPQFLPPVLLGTAGGVRVRFE